MPTQIALFRGINVGKAKRVAMPELRDALAGLGYSNVRTLLNSGNAVFDSPRRLTSAGAMAIRDAVTARTGVVSEVTTLTASDLAIIVGENRLADLIDDPSRGLVAFPVTAAALSRAKGLEDRDHSPERFAVGSRAAYFWCPSGILGSNLLVEFGRLLGTAVTTRNWATVLKLRAMVEAPA
ncbi:MAG: DUF1697 domain-containing protein [Isosphaeraceae bacterium]